MSPRLFLDVVSVDARKRMSYRANFWLAALLGMGVTFCVYACIVRAIFRESGLDRIGGMSAPDMMTYYLAVILVARLVTATEMDHAISQDIYEGSLSRYLIYPVPYPIVKFAEQCGALVPSLIQIAIFSAWMPIAFGWPAGVTSSSILMGIVAIAVACVLQFSITWPLQAVAFWADNVWSLTVGYRIVSRLLGGMTLPLSVFPTWSQGALDLLPFKYLFAFPVDALLGRLSLGQWAQGLVVGTAWCLVLAFVGSAVWRRGNFQYSGVGM